MKKPFIWKNPTAIRLTAAEEASIKDLLIQALPDYDFENSTGRSLFLALVERCLSKIEVHTETRPEDAEHIQQLTNEIGRLKIDIDLKSQKIDKATELYVLTAQKNSELEKAAELNTIAENHYLIELPPVCVKVLEIEAEAAQKKTGKRFSIAEILYNSFWESVTVGRVYPWRQWSQSEISNIAKAIKYAE